MANFLKKIAAQYKFSKSKLSFGEKVALALPGPASVIGPIIIHNAMIKFYTDIIGIDPKYVGWIYIIYNIWNAINDPLLGAWVDRMKYNEKRGKYVYLMKVTVPFMLLSTLGMFLTSPAWNDMVVFFVFLAELFIFDTAYTVYSVAYQSYFLIAAPTKEERVDVDIIRTFLGNVVGAVTTIIPTLLMVGNGKRSLVIPALSAVVAMNAVLYLIAFRTLKDKGELYANEVHEEHKPFRETAKEAWAIIKQPAFITYLLFYITARGSMEYYYTPFLYFMDDVLCSNGIVATIADTVPGLFMLALIPIFGNIIKKYGSKAMSIFSLIPAAIGFGGLLFITEAWQAVICYCFIVLALNICQRAGVVLNGDLIDDDERRTGIRKTGLYGGVFSLLATSLTGLQQLVFTNVISAYGYNGELEVQTAHAVTGIRIGAGLVPLIMCVVGLIPMLFFPIGRKKEQELSEYMDRRRSSGDFEGAPKAIKTNRRSFIGPDGEKISLQGVNMVCKDAKVNHIGPYDDDAFLLLKHLGLNVIRLGIYWESIEPEPGVYDDAYLAEIDKIVARAKRFGVFVYLDMHQDLFSSVFEDGAPEWATLTDGKQHMRTQLWSESYLFSGAVQAAFDNFWNNTPAKDGTGIQDHFIKAWEHIAAHYADEPYVIGYDFFNEPFQGSSVAAILPAIAQIDEKLTSGTASEQEMYATIGAIETVSGAFEEEYLNPFYEKIVAAVRKADPECIVFLETSYFCNAAVPSHVKPVSFDGHVLKNQVYAPHGYDIFVDTDGYDNNDTSRVDMIFLSHARTAEALGLPMMVGEWGCYPHATENQLKQARHLKELFESLGASDTYFDFSQLAGNKITDVLKR